MLISANIMELPVEKILKEKGVKYRLIPLSESAYTVEDVLSYSDGNVNPDQICKTIILRGKKTGKKVAILLRGNDKVNFSAAKKIFGEEMAIASSEEVKEAANVEPGAVCPFMLNVDLKIDKKVMELETINCGSGHHLYGLEFKLRDLTRTVDYEIVDVAKDNVTTN